MLKLKDNISLDDFNNFVNNMNSKINQSEEIDDEEYYFSYMINHKYQQNLKIIIPSFEPLDVFYLYKLGDIFFGTVCNFGGINDIPEEIFKNDFKDMNEIEENLAIYFAKIFVAKNMKKEYL